jgi:hypothetical protein
MRYITARRELPLSASGQLCRILSARHRVSKKSESGNETYRIDASNQPI